MTWEEKWRAMLIKAKAYNHELTGDRLYALAFLGMVNERIQELKGKQ